MAFILIKSVVTTSELSDSYRYLSWYNRKVFISDIFEDLVYNSYNKNRRSLKIPMLICYSSSNETFPLTLPFKVILEIKDKNHFFFFYMGHHVSWTLNFQVFSTM